MARIDTLLDRQSDALDLLVDREEAAFLRAYRGASRELVAQLAVAASDVSRQSLRVRLAQLRSGAQQLEDRMGLHLDDGVRKASESALADLLAVIRRAEPILGEVGGLVEVGALRRLSRSRGLALHRFSLETYGKALVGQMQRDLVRSTALGETVDQMERRLKRTLVGKESRAQLIVRMELSRTYNDAALESIREAAAQLPGGMMKRIHETKDRRNHPFSRAAHGTMAMAGEVFKVPSAAVAAAGAAIGKSTGGILWDRKGANFVGMNLPAHFGERGRVVPFRKAWATPDILPQAVGP